MNLKAQMESEPEAIARQLLGRAADEVVRVGGGGNSRIYRVRSGGECYALKAYPTIERDPRDRLGTEKRTLQFFERHGIASVPRWIADCQGYALLSWVEGELANPPSPEEMDSAIRFIADIKHLSGLPGAAELPMASEACLSAGEIVRQIATRLARLEEVLQNEPSLAGFLTERFAPALERAREEAVQQYAAHGLAFNDPITEGRCLIPADFGFHNAMRGPEGQVTFIDFEYFGWDDPVKLVADFLLHPAMSLPARQRERFRQRMLEIFRDDPFFALRLDALTPLFALRWALILLNEFLPERWSGRAFAQGTGEWEAAKIRQLRKAEKLMKNEYGKNHA